MHPCARTSGDLVFFAAAPVDICGQRLQLVVAPYGKSEATDIPALEEPTRRCREQGGDAPRRLLGISAMMRANVEVGSPGAIVLSKVIS